MKKTGGKRRASGKLGVREIARRVGVSPITVSRALNDPESVAEATRARIMEVIDKVGFVPNRVAGSFRGATKIIGTIVPPLINGGIAEQVQGMSDACMRAGYELMLFQGEISKQAEDEAIKSLLSWRPAGLIIQAFVQGPQARRMLKGARIPIVEVSEIRGRRPLDMAVGVSNSDASYHMTLWLAKRGYRRIGFVGTPPHGHDRQGLRLVGYRRAMTDLGLSPVEAIVPLTIEGGARAVGLLLAKSQRLEALFCSSDTLAIGAIQECHRRGWHVPNRLAVAGYGDWELAATLDPRVTTVRIDRYHMGRIAVERVISRLTGAAQIEKLTDLGFSIVARESA